jgi:hypothetical protein
MQGMALVDSTTFVPPFVGFERLTHMVLREYLCRVIAPTLVEEREKRAREKAKAPCNPKALAAAKSGEPRASNAMDGEVCGPHYHWPNGTES